MKLDGYSTEMMLSALSRLEYKSGRYLSPLRSGSTCTEGSRSSTAALRRWDPSLPREFKEYFDEAVAKGWQIVPTTTDLAHRLRGGREPAAAGARLRPDDRRPSAEARSAGHRRLADEQHGALQRLRVPGRGLVREGRPHLGFAHHALLPRHHPRRRAPGRVEARLGSSTASSSRQVQQRAIERGDLRVRGSRGRRSGVWTACTTSSPSGGRYTEENTEEFLDEMLSSPRISAASGGRRSRRRATRATRASA